MNITTIGRNKQVSRLKRMNEEERCFIPLFLETGETVQFETKRYLMFFLLKGAAECSIDYNEKIKLEAPGAYLVPKGKFYEHETILDSELVVLPLKSYVDLLCIPYDRMSEDDVRESSYFYSLTLTQPLISYFNLLGTSISYGLNDPAFIELKIRELMFIIKKEYKNTERMLFFYPLFEREPEFVDFVYANYKEVKNVKALAELSCYSQSGFEKKFRKVFGVPPSKWLRYRVTIDVYNDLIKSVKPFKEISQDYGFSSPSHFNNFCRDTLGGTPGELRKRVIIPEKS